MPLKYYWSAVTHLCQHSYSCLKYFWKPLNKLCIFGDCPWAGPSMKMDDLHSARLEELGCMNSNHCAPSLSCGHTQNSATHLMMRQVHYSPQKNKHLLILLVDFSTFKNESDMHNVLQVATDFQRYPQLWTILPELYGELCEQTSHLLRSNIQNTRFNHMWWSLGQYGLLSAALISPLNLMQ
jgi:hypothetical protein